MDGRKRTVQIKFRVTEAERDLILEKMKLVPTRNMAAYLRKIAIDGYIIQVDHEAAAKALKTAGITKLPNPATLQKEYEALQAQKEALYAESFGGALQMTDDITYFITHWEAEAYRSKK